MLMHRPGELVKKAEGQRGTAAYTEEVAAKLKLDDGAKERWCLPASPWARVIWGVCVAVYGSACRLECPA